MFDCLAKRLLRLLQYVFFVFISFFNSFVLQTQAIFNFLVANIVCHKNHIGKVEKLIPVVTVGELRIFKQNVVGKPANKSVVRGANNESSEVFDIIKPGHRVKIKGYRQ